MKVIFNSDMLYAKHFLLSLPNHVKRFLIHCKDGGHEIIIPETTLFEFDRVQTNSMQVEIDAIEKAKSKLRSHGFVVDESLPEDKVEKPDLIQLIADLGVICEKVSPTLADYKDAHRRACLREPPHPATDTKSDEMRDLVIWAVAIRLAAQCGGALLVSRDKIHNSHLGDLQASDNNLLRTDDFDRAREILGIETKSASIIKALLDAEWERIVASELPIIAGAQVQSVLRPRFWELANGSTRANAEINMRTGDGEEIFAMVSVEYDGDQIGSVCFDPVPNGENTLESVVRIEIADLEPDKSDTDERLIALRETLEGST